MYKDYGFSIFPKCAVESLYRGQSLPQKWQPGMDLSSTLQLLSNKEMTWTNALPAMIRGKL